MLILLSIWLATGLALILIVSQRQGSAGLPLAYFLGLSLIHVPGAVLYLNSDEIDTAALVTRIGFEQTIIGMVAFSSGVLIARYAFGRAAKQQSLDIQLKNFSSQTLALVDSLARVYLCIGIVTLFVAWPVIAAIPSAAAVGSTLGWLTIVGACLRLWVASRQGRALTFWLTVALLPLLPLVTVVQSGFIGFGTYWALVVVAFVFAQSRLKAVYLLCAPAFFFLGLSIFVNYMGARNDIRQLVWYEQVGIEHRLQRIANVFENFAWLDLSNPLHHEAIEGRLNQNVLVGTAVARLESGAVEYAYGETAGNLILGLIPRALWPDKPTVGGGGTIVQDFTGIEFAEGTSVGAGQVLEFYVNFGMLGVIGGFFLYGLLIGRLDFLAKGYLDHGDQKRFLFCFLICLDLLQPGGNLREIIIGAASAIITAYGLGLLLHRYWVSNATTVPEMIPARR